MAERGGVRRTGTWSSGSVVDIDAPDGSCAHVHWDWTASADKAHEGVLIHPRMDGWKV
jgi:hypothetical protein